MSLQQRSKNRKWVIIGSPIVLLCTLYYGLTYGAVDISLREIWTVLISEGEPVHETIIQDLRLPRVIIGALVGACLAVSGALLQGVMKNPLADPGIIGVSAGGGLAAVITMILLPQISYLLPVAAFIGAFLTAVIIYVVAWDKGASPVKIILAGVACVIGSDSKWHHGCL